MGEGRLQVPAGPAKLWRSLHVPGPANGESARVSLHSRISVAMEVTRPAPTWGMSAWKVTAALWRWIYLQVMRGTQWKANVRAGVRLQLKKGLVS